MKEYAKSIIIPMVDFPDDINIQETEEDDKTLILVIKVNSKDVGKLIGRKGRNITALRTLVNAVGAKNDQRVIIESII